MRWLLGLLLAVLAFVTLCMAILVYLVPDTAIERHILATAGRATNSTITTSGLPEISLFPSIEMTLKGVEMHTERANTAFTLKAGKVSAEVSWMAILTRWTIDIAELKLVEPQIRVFEASVASPPAAQPVAYRRLYPAPAIVVRQVGIENGTIEGVSDWRIKAVNAVVPSENLGSKMDVNVDFLLNGEKVIGNFKLKDPEALQAGHGSPLTAAFGGESGSIDLNGIARLSAEPYYEGNVALKTADLDAASRWLGFGGAAKYNGKAASIGGGVSYGKDAITLNAAGISLAGRTATVTARLERTPGGLTARDITISGLDANAAGLPRGADIKNLTARFERLQLGSPAKAALTFDLNGKAAAGTASVPDIDIILAEPETAEIPLKAEFEVPGGTVAFDGKLTPDSQLNTSESAQAWAAVGRLGLKAEPARDMAEVFGIELPENDAYRSVAFDADIRAAAGTVNASNANGIVDDTAFSGNLNADWSRERPAFSATLTLDRIDTARYFSAAPAPAQAMTRAAAADVPAAAFNLEFVPLKTSLEAYLATTAAGTGPSAHAPSAATGRRAVAVAPAAREVWGNTTLGLDKLRKASSDLAFDLKIGDLRHGEYELGKSDLSATLESGSLDLVIREIQPGEGRISGKVNVDTTAEAPAFDIALDIGGVLVEKVLKTAGRPVFLRGKLTGKALLKASGRTEADVIGSLSGMVTGQLRDGAIVGYDIRRALRPFASREYDPRNTTPYERIDAKFEIADGLARSDAISLDGPSIRLRGDGTANLKTAALDYNSHISLVPPPPNFSVPVKIQGTWERIEAVLDWARLASQWTGESPFPDLGAARRALTRSVDPDMKKLIEELVARQGGKGVPPVGADLLRELTGK